MTTYLSRPERVAELDSLAASGPEGPPSFEPSLMGGSLTAVPRGLAASLLDVGLLATEQYGADPYDPNADARDLRLRNESTGAQVQRIGRKAAELVAPDPVTTGVVGELLFSLSRVIPQAVLGAAAGAGGGPVGMAAGGAALPTILQGNAARARWESKGLDPATANIMGAIEGVSTGAGMLVSPFFGKAASSAASAYVTNFVAQGGINVAMGVASRVGMRETLLAKGRDALADQIHPMASAEVLTDFFLGGAFSVLGTRGARSEAQARALADATPTLTDAIDMARGETLDDAMTVNRAGHMQVDTMPGTPVDIGAINAHAEAMVEADWALLSGNPVAVEHLMVDAKFDPPTIERDLTAEANTALVDAMTEADRVRSLEYGFDPYIAPPEPTGPTPAAYGETARRQFLQAIKKIGGITAAEIRDITGETGGNGFRTMPGLFRNAGQEIDRVAERLHELGYLTDEEYADVDGATARTRELVRQALDKQAVLRNDQWDEMARLEAEHEAAGFDATDFAQARYDDLPPPDQLEFQRWLAYADDLERADNEIQRILASGQDAILGADEALGAGRAEAGAGSDQGGQSLQEVTRRYEGGNRQGEKLNEPPKDTYTQDLFGNALPDRPGIVRGESANGDRGGLAAIPAKREEVSPGLFANVTSLRQIGVARLGVERVASVADAAHVFAALRKDPQESVVVLHMDAERRPIRIVEHSLGGRGATPFEASTLVGGVFRDKRVAGIYVAHNHPSGTLAFSAADATVHNSIRRAMVDSGVQYEGFFVIADKKYSHWRAREVPVKINTARTGWEFDRQIDAAGDERDGIPAHARTNSIPIERRVFSKRGALGPAITGPSDMLLAAVQHGKGKPGIMFLDNQYKPVAWIDNDLSEIFSKGTIDNVYAAMEASNAAHMLPVTDQPFATAPLLALSELNRMGAAVNVAVLDVVSIKDRGTASWKPSPEAHAVAKTFREGEPDLLTPYTDADIKQREAEAMALSKRDAAQRKAADDKAIADAQRDAFALTGSDRPADDLKQSTLFEPARKYYDTGPDALMGGKGWGRVDQAMEWLGDDRSHGDDYVAEAAREVFQAQGAGYGRSKDVAGFVQKVIDRAAEMRAEDDAPMLGEPAPGYAEYPGTVDDPMPRESLMAAADARVAEAEKAEPALMAAINCALSQGEA